MDYIRTRFADVWCNPPHSKTEKFVRKAVQQWAKHNISIMMIIPANSICTKYAEQCIEPHAEYHPIFFRPKFLRDGVASKDPSRNSYFVVIWRRTWTPLATSSVSEHPSEKSTTSGARTGDPSGSAITDAVHVNITSRLIPSDAHAAVADWPTAHAMQSQSERWWWREYELDRNYPYECTVQKLQVHRM